MTAVGRFRVCGLFQSWSGTAFVFAFAALATSALGEKKGVIQQLTSIFENSSTELNYTFCENIGDQRGWTFGFAGFTSGTYSGTFFLQEYRRLRPRNPLNRFLPAFRRIDRGPHDAEGRNPDTRGLERFPEVFRSLGGDRRFRRAQHNLVDRLAWRPAKRTAGRLRTRWPLTTGQLYDGYVNHGEGGMRRLLERTRRRARGTPATGISERHWLKTFLRVRLRVLEADPVWALAVDRIAVYRRLLRSKNTALKTPFPVSCYGNHFIVRNRVRNNSR